MTRKTVTVPEPLEELFRQAEEYVGRYFDSTECCPEKGTIMIDGERYILVRASSLSVHFLEYIGQTCPGMDDASAIDTASKVLFDVAHNIGRLDAKAFHRRSGVDDPIARLSAGPVHFAYTGWANVCILPESTPSPDEDYLLVYDHPYSFEAESWVKERGKVDFCTCFMNAGYSSGWCEESFGIELTARELLCRAKQDPCCRFVMSQPHRIDEFCSSYLNEHPELFA